MDYRHAFGGPIDCELITRPKLAESLSTVTYQELPKYQWQNIAKRVEDVYSGILGGPFNRRIHLHIPFQGAVCTTKKRDQI